MSGFCLRFREARFELVGEHVAHGDELGVGVGLQRALTAAPVAAAAAADQADFQHVAPGRVDEREIAAATTIAAPTAAVDCLTKSRRDTEEAVGFGVIEFSRKVRWATLLHRNSSDV